MTDEQYKKLNRVNSDVGHLSELLDQLSMSFDHDQPSGALQACATIARGITYRIAELPGYLAAETRAGS